MPKRFTKKQLEVMKILWDNPDPMIASDIVKKGKDLNINTVQACLRGLVKEDAIKVADIVYSGTVLTRSYVPLVTREDYLDSTYKDLLGKDDSSALIASLIEDVTDVKELDKIEKMIKKRKTELNRK